MAASSRTVAAENVIMSTANPAQVAVDSPNSRRGAFTVADVMLIIRPNSRDRIPAHDRLDEQNRRKPVSHKCV